MPSVRPASLVAPRTGPTALAAACLALLPLALPQAVAARPAAAAQEVGQGVGQTAPTEPLTIAGPGGTHRFDVEVMRTDADRSRGLMFRRSMAPGHGMLFDFEQSAPVAMWMKNTYLPLDMVFIDADGTVSRIAADTEPLSTAVISSGGPVLAVLELNAGTAARLGLKVGDRVQHPLFKPR